VRGLVILGLLLSACSERTPPPGSGSLETTPTGSAAKSPEPSSEAAVLTYPNGSVAVIDPAKCSVHVLRDGGVRWSQVLAGCAGFLESNVAMDGTLYVRDPKTLSAFDPGGALRWAKKLPDGAMSLLLAVPAVLADSRAAIASAARSVTVFERDGAVSWSFSLPSGEELVAPPEGMKTEGLIVTTSRAVYYLSTSGEVHWRADSPSRAP